MLGVKTDSKGHGWGGVVRWNVWIATQRPGRGDVLSGQNPPAPQNRRIVPKSTRERYRDWGREKDKKLSKKDLCLPNYMLSRFSIEGGDLPGTVSAGEKRTGSGGAIMIGGVFRNRIKEEESSDRDP